MKNGTRWTLYFTYFLKEDAEEDRKMFDGRTKIVQINRPAMGDLPRHTAYQLWVTSKKRMV